MTIEQTVIPKEQTSNYTAVKIIGLIADTHIPSRANSIPQGVFKAFEKVDFIIHAGDLVELKVIDELEQIAPVLAVRGNMDVSEVKDALPRIDSLKIYDWKIGVMHDPNIMVDMNEMREIAKQNAFNVFVYGYTHNANIKWEEKALYINPGSPTNPSSFINKCSVALLRITKNEIKPEIIHI